MQAGVPMVPIVIRNAGDVAPKGDFVYRAATVDVEVLPPTSVSRSNSLLRYNSLKMSQVLLWAVSGLFTDAEKKALASGR